MKALHVATHFNIGGISNYILTLAEALKGRGVECVVASSGGNLENKLSDAGIKHVKINIDTKFEFGPRAISSGFALARIAKEERADIIHAHTRVSQVASSIASCLTGIPFVTTCHGYFKLRTRKIFDTWGVNVIAISGAVKEHLEKDLGVKEERVRLIYSGVDIARFSKAYPESELKAVKASLGLGKGPVAGTIGRLSPVKGHSFFIKAIKALAPEIPDIQALIVGSGDEEMALKDLAGSSGLKGTVHFVEAHPDTRKLLAVMDIFIFPSIKEGLGIALLEALGAGKACVASNVGGIGDIIEDGVSGFLVPAGDPGAIAGAALKLLRDDELRRRMGENGRGVVKKSFSLDLMAEQAAELYKEVVGRRSSVVSHGG